MATQRAVDLSRYQFLIPLWIIVLPLDRAGALAFDLHFPFKWNKTHLGTWWPEPKGLNSSIWSIIQCSNVRLARATSPSCFNVGVFLEFHRITLFHQHGEKRLFRMTSSVCVCMSLYYTPAALYTYYWVAFAIGANPHFRTAVPSLG